MQGWGRGEEPCKDARLWPRRRGEHWNGPERNINKRTPAGPSSGSSEAGLRRRPCCPL